MDPLARLLRLLRAEWNAARGRRGPPPPPRDAGAWRARPPGGEPPPPPPPRDPLARHWAALELPPGAPPDEVRAAYRRLAKRYHPDRYADPEERRIATEVLKRLNEAMAALSRAGRAG